MLNLIPIGQLDGGHVAIAYFGNRYGHVSRWMRKLLLPLAVFITMLVYRSATIDLMRTGEIISVSPWDIAIPAGMSWLVWYVMLGLMQRMAGGIDHPPVDDRPLPASRTVLFAMVVIAFIITFMPIPIRQSIPAPPRDTAVPTVQARLSP
jgi:membrane-associated protease RseP (regulator of RpoE activity)